MAKRTSVYFDRELIQFVGLDDAIKKHLEKAYNDIDIDKELNKMILWLLSPKGRKRKGDLTFITGWLERANPKFSLNSHETFNIEETDLRAWRDEYLKVLWKDREHILEFNKKISKHS